MVEQYLPMIQSRAGAAYRKIKETNPVPYDDCLSEAYLLFSEALLKYDSTREAKFSTYLYSYLKNLENKILLANRVSSFDTYKYQYPIELDENIVQSRARIPIEELSDDGRKIVSLLLEGHIGGDYGTGKGKKLPGRKRIPPFMKKHYGWSYKKTEIVLSEITDWWRDVK